MAISHMQELSLLLPKDLLDDVLSYLQNLQSVEIQDLQAKETWQGAFEQMQEIEQAADEVLASYKSQIQELREQASSNLKQLEKVYDEEKQQLLVELKEQSEKEIANLTQDLEKTRQENEEKAQAALSNKKEVLLQMIVDRVVEKYGH